MLEADSMSCHCHNHDKCCNHKHNHNEHSELKNNIIKFSIGLVFLIVGIVLENFEKNYTEFDWSYFSQTDFYSSYLFISFIIYLIGYIFLVIDLVKESVEAFKEKEYINEFTLMIIATIGAFAIGEFFEALLVLLLNIIGETLEDYATDKSKASIKKLINNMPLYAHKISEDNSIIDIDPNKVNIGDILEIRPGEKIAIDGIVIQGETNLDLSSINGESLPKESKVNDNVYSGSINLTSIIHIKTTKLYKDSTLSQIMQLVENEQTKKAKTEKFITRFAKYYTPLVVLIALAIFIIGFGLSNWDFNNGGKEWLYKALSILLISCPCALVIAVPISFFTGIGVSSKLGILIKGSISLENFSKAKYFIFDKTGTLTKGNFVLINKPDLKNLQIAASLESKSTHPIGVAITSANKLPLLKIDKLTDIPGLGIQADIGDKTYLIGKLDLLKTNNVKNLPKEISPYKEIYLGEKDGEFLQTFIIADEIKLNAKQALNFLKQEKIKKTIMLSGDDTNIAQNVAKELNIDEVHGNLLPQDKLNKVKELTLENKTCFVGDGINDSPSLLASNIGVAMGGLGSDAAIEASDIVIMDDNLIKLAEAKSISKRTLLTAYTGIIFSILIKVLFMILVSLGYFGDYAMIVGTLADTGVMAICVLNAMSVLLYKPKYIKSNN